MGHCGNAYPIAGGDKYEKNMEKHCYDREINMIYGVAVLSACMLLGSLIGTVFGDLIGAGTEVGGVGFAMLLLIFVTNSKKLTFTQKPAFVQGINFWKAMFIPVVIAMTATQNVFNMLSSGIVAIVAGAAAVGFSFLMLFVLHKLDQKKAGGD